MVVALTGSVWRRMVVVAPKGNDRERERFGEHLARFSLYQNQACPCSDVLMVQCWTWLVNDVSQREWTSRWQLGKVLRGQMVLWRKFKWESVGLERVETK